MGPWFTSVPLHWPVRIDASSLPEMLSAGISSWSNNFLEVMNNSSQLPLARSVLQIKRCARVCPMPSCPQASITTASRCADGAERQMTSSHLSPGTLMQNDTKQRK